MTSKKIKLIWVLFMVACSSPDVLAANQVHDCSHVRQIHGDMDKCPACQDLRDALRDKERSQLLLRDRTLIHNLLKQPELRQEMLLYPRFMRQMMQSSEMRQELLQNEQMMHEMLKNRDIHSEINRNREMLEEIEKNEAYRQLNQEQHADILEKLLLEPAVSGTPSPGSGRCP